MPGLFTFRLPFAVVGLFAAIGCKAMGQGDAAAPPVVPTGAIFSVDGSAGLRSISGDLNQTVCEAGLPLQVMPFQWSHGAGMVMIDLRRHERHHAKGQELAGCIVAFREANPGVPVYLVAHSSGAAVALAAAGYLPPGSVTRIVLLAPAVSPSYDLRPALRASVQGIDSFYSCRDLVSRSLVLTGTADGRHEVSAGGTPFVIYGGCPDSNLYTNLRQYEYGQGGAGGHFGCTKAPFFRSRLIPLLSCGCGQ